MEIIIHGTGAMGRLIKETAENNENIRITGFTDELATETGDVIIDFSHYSRLNSLLDYSKEKRIPLVIATTGYSNEILKKIKEAAREIPVLLSSNMSLGVSLLNDILERIVPVLYGNYDIEVIEKHHNKKVDAPSGTAKMIANAINKELDDSMEFNYGRSGNDAKRKEKEIGIHAIRGGTIPGEHTVIFAGLDEIVEIKHTALSKKVFAQGSIKAAQYILNKENGLYDMNNLINNN